jgi:hypothetical protein
MIINPSCTPQTLSCPCVVEGRRVRLLSSSSPPSTREIFILLAARQLGELQCKCKASQGMCCAVCSNLNGEGHGAHLSAISPRLLSTKQLAFHRQSRSKGRVRVTYMGVAVLSRRIVAL